MAHYEAADPISARELQSLFDRLFKSSYNVCLKGGAVEPLYEPATTSAPATIYFRADYPRSALHEVAHWCHAGAGRRGLVDYGYWYSPDDRSAQEQAAFFAVEAKPQALESLFCSALGLSFAPSIDNLSLPITEQDRRDFERRIQQAIDHYGRVGLPKRAALFHRALMAHAKTLR